MLLQMSGWQGAQALHAEGGSAVAYTGMMDCLVRTVKEEGVRALFKVGCLFLRAQCIPCFLDLQHPCMMYQFSLPPPENCVLPGTLADKERLVFPGCTAAICATANAYSKSRCCAAGLVAKLHKGCAINCHRLRDIRKVERGAGSGAPDILMTSSCEAGPAYAYRSMALSQQP